MKDLGKLGSTMKVYPKEIEEFLETEFGMKVFHTIIDDAESQVQEGFEEAYKILVELKEAHAKEMNKIKIGLQKYLGMNELESEAFMIKVNQL